MTPAERALADSLVQVRTPEAREALSLEYRDLCRLGGAEERRFEARRMLLYLGAAQHLFEAVHDESGWQI